MVAQRAEELGFHRVWFYDSQLLCSDVFVIMATAAAATKKIRLATGVLIPSNRIAPVAANAFATLNAMAPGRIDCGIGTGFTARRTIWEEVVSKQSKYEFGVQKKALLEALDRIAAVMNERSRGVRLRRVEDGLEISGKKPDAGELTITIPASGWKEGELLGVNLGYLHDAVRFAPSEEVAIGLSDESSPMKIVDGPYLALVMPIRLERGGIP